MIFYVIELFYQNVIYKFSIGRQETISFKNLGLNIKSSKYQITVDRSDYTEQLKKSTNQINLKISQK